MGITGLSLNGSPGMARTITNKTPVGTLSANILIPVSNMDGLTGALGSVDGNIPIPVSAISGLTGALGSMDGDISVPVSNMNGSIPATYTSDLLSKPYSTDTMLELVPCSINKEKGLLTDISLGIEKGVVVLGFQEKEYGCLVRWSCGTIFEKIIIGDSCKSAEVFDSKILSWTLFNQTKIRSFVTGQCVEEIVKQKKGIDIQFKFNIKNGHGRIFDTHFGVYATKDKTEKPLMVIENPKYCSDQGLIVGIPKIKWDKKGGLWILTIPSKSSDSFFIGTRQIFPMMLINTSSGGGMGTW